MPLFGTYFQLASRLAKSTVIGIDKARRQDQGCGRAVIPAARRPYFLGQNYLQIGSMGRDQIV
jgi:hypothetical protein